jgi:putative phosphoesterase
MRVGVISDTHGLVRPEAKRALAGVELIVHAGDVGGPEVLAELAELARVEAVRGNNDVGAWARALPETRTLKIQGHTLYVLHDVKELGRIPDGAEVIIAGHSHQPRNERIDGRLYLNPGSAGPRRFKLPICVALLELSKRGIDAEIVTLSVA